LGGNLDEIIVKMAVVKIAETVAPIVAWEFRMYSFRPHAEKWMITDHAESGRQHFHAPRIRCELALKTHPHTVIDEPGRDKGYKRQRQNGLHNDSARHH